MKKNSNRKMEDKGLDFFKIDKAKPKNKDYQLRDKKGLYLNIKTNGNKIWHLRYTSPTNKKRKAPMLGIYPSMSLSEARIKRDEYKELILQGVDPIEDKLKSEKQSLLNVNGMYANLIEEWLEKESKRTIASTHKAKKRVFYNDVKPYIGKKHIKDVDTDDIVRILEQKQIQAPEIASRLFNHLDNLFRYAVLKKYCDRNILADIRKLDIIAPRQSKHYPKITNKEILKELVDSIYNYNGGYSIRNALKLVLHLPLRAENLCNLKWEQINLEKKTLTIPRSNMKLKNINLDDFVLPLTNEVITILREQQTIQTKYTELKKYVFLGTDNNSPIGKESPNRALERLGFNDEKRDRKIRLHGFRGTFRSLIDSLDTKNEFSFEVKERALDHHEKNSVARAYNHKANYSEQMRVLVSFWSDFICGLIQKG